jgi:3-hydroxyacyl-CoA dehydrogenase
MRHSSKKPGVDVVLDVLNLLNQSNPDSAFITSLLAQYRERGSLSRKQLQGLVSKGKKAGSVPEPKLSTIEAIILKMPVREKAPPTISAIIQEETKDPLIEEQLNQILTVFPSHKRALYLKAKYDNGESISPAEKKELIQFEQIALKKKGG